MRTLMLFVTVFVALSHLVAQADKAVISGTATDASGAVVVGAKIEAKNVGTGATFTAVTDSAGRYLIPQLPVGNYQIQASQSGFRKVLHSGITLSVGSHPVIDFQLPVGLATEVLEVQGQVSQVETQSATVASLIAPKQMQDLPLNGRNFEQLLSLAPGVQFVPQQNGGGGISNSFYGSENNYSVSGSRPVGQSFLLDNTDITNFWQHGAGSSVTGNSLGMDAIQEFTVLTNTYSAEYGGTGAAVNAVTKSGTNNLHGSAYEFFRNSVLDAKNYFDLPTLPIPAYHRNQFGGALGGPIKKDKLFFFFNYEGLRAEQFQTGEALVPVDSLMQAAFATNPNSYIRSILNIYEQYRPNAPAGTYIPGATPGLNDWNISIEPFIVNEDYVLGRLDYNIGPKDTFFMRYVHDGANQQQPYPSSTLPGWPENDNTGNHYFTAEERRTVSNTMVNAVRFSAVRTNESAIDGGDTPALAIVPGRQNAVVSPGSGMASVGPGSGTPYWIIQNKFTGADDVIFSHGAHSIRFGASIVRIQSGIDAPFANGGFWIFNTFPYFLADQPFLYLGMAAPDNTFTDSAGNTYGYGERHYFRDLELMPYIQDDWKVSRRLTLNLGVRYEWLSNGTAAGGVPLEAVTNPVTSTNFSPVSHVLGSNPNVKNIDPRIGLAWDPFNDHKTSVRAGFGMFYEPVGPRTYSPSYYMAPPTVQYEVISLPGLGIPAPPSLFFPNLASNNPNSPGYTSGLVPAVFSGLDYQTDHAPYVMQFNLTLQREISNGTVFSVGYIGSAGVHMMTSHDANPPLAASNQFYSDGVKAPTYNPLAYGPPGSPTNPFVGALANQAFESISTDEATSHSSYHSLQLMLNRQFSHDLIGQVAYTWSKCLDDGSVTSGLEQGIHETVDTYNQSYDRGPCTFNASQAFRMNAVYSLPFKGNRAVSGWQVSPIFSASTGLPVNVQDGMPAGGQANIGGLDEAARPSYAPGGCKDQYLRTVQNWYNPECYILPAYGTLGNVPRDSLVGPGLMDLDFSIIKDTKLTERLNMQLRAEFFNIMNHPNFGSPSGAFVNGSPISAPAGQFPVQPPTLNPADYEVTGGTVGSLTCNMGTTCYNPNAGRLTYTSVSSRQIQFALRFTF
jgi:hypothetical protein